MQDSVNVNAASGQRRLRLAVDIAAGCIGRAVGAIRADREDGGAVHTGDAGRGSQRKLLIAPAKTVSGQMHDRFTARDQSKRLCRVLVRARQTGKPASGLARLTVKTVGQKLRRIAKCLRGLGRGGAELTDASGDARLDIGKRFGRFLRQQCARLFIQTKLIARRDLLRLRAGAGVGIGRARGDHIQRVTQHIRKDDRVDVRRGAGQREAPALDGRKTLADGVDLGDVRAAGEQLLRDTLKRGERDKRLFKQCRAAAREQEQNGVVFAKPRDQIECRLCAAQGVFIRYGMPALIAADVWNLALYVVIFCHAHAAVQARAQNLRGTGRHLPRGLACGDQNQLSRRKSPAIKRLFYGLIGEGALNCGAKDRICILT